MIARPQDEQHLAAFYAYKYTGNADSAFFYAQKIIHENVHEDATRFYISFLSTTKPLMALNLMHYYADYFDFNMELAKYYASKNFYDSAIFFLSHYLNTYQRKSQSALYSEPEFAELQKSVQWKHLMSKDYDTPALKLAFEVNFLMKIGNKAKALQLLDEFLLKYKNHQIYAQRAEILFLLEDYRAALADYERAYRLLALSEYKMGMALALFSLKKYAKASKYLADLLKKEKYNFRAMEVMVFSAYHSKDFDLAEKYALQYSKLIDNDSIEFKLAQIYYQKFDFFSSLMHVNKAIRLNSFQEEYYKLRGQIYYQNKNYIVAEQDFTLYLDFNPRDAEILFLRGESRYFLNKPEQACKDWKSAAKYNYSPAVKNFALYCK